VAALSGCGREVQAAPVAIQKPAASPTAVSSPDPAVADIVQRLARLEKLAEKRADIVQRLARLEKLAEKRSAKGIAELVELRKELAKLLTDLNHSRSQEEMAALALVSQRHKTRFWRLLSLITAACCVVASPKIRGFLRTSLARGWRLFLKKVGRKDKPKEENSQPEPGPAPEPMNGGDTDIVTVELEECGPITVEDVGGD
jgi:hypothetical protein